MRGGGLSTGVSGLCPPPSGSRAPDVGLQEGQKPGCAPRPAPPANLPPPLPLRPPFPHPHLSVRLSAEPSSVGSRTWSPGSPRVPGSAPAGLGHLQKLLCAHPPLARPVEVWESTEAPFPPPSPAPSSRLASAGRVHCSGPALWTQVRDPPGVLGLLLGTQGRSPSLLGRGRGSCSHHLPGRGRSQPCSWPGEVGEGLRAGSPRVPPHTPPQWTAPAAGAPGGGDGGKDLSRCGEPSGSPTPSSLVGVSYPRRSQ